MRLMGFFEGLKGSAAAPPEPHFSDLTGREREILVLIAHGANNQPNAERLIVSPKTVRIHSTNIFSKLQVADHAQAIVRVTRASVTSAASRPRCMPQLRGSKGVYDQAITEGDEFVA